MLNVSAFVPHPRPVIDTRRADTARVRIYWLDGKDSDPLDHGAGAQIRARTPEIVDLVRASRGFPRRAGRPLRPACLIAVRSASCPT